MEMAGRTSALRPIFAALAGLLVAVAGVFVPWRTLLDSEPPVAGVAPGPASSAGGEAPPVTTETYAAALTRLDAQIESQRRRADTMATSWMPLRGLAASYMARARLTGSYDDYERAEAALSTAFERAPASSGPHLAQASLDFTLHRIARVEPSLIAAEGRARALAAPMPAILGLRGDAAFHSGRYEAALAAYGESERMDPTSTAAFRLAHYYWRTADFDRAEAMLLEAHRRVPGARPQARAFLHLQQGLMDLDRGRHDEALAHYRDAEAQVEGWWLIEEHIAEIDALEGRGERAEATYRRLIEETGNPEFMDALADSLEARGDAEHDTLRARALGVYEARLEQLPEATYGHALDHFLASDDAARALELARANYALRPGGDARLKLALALVKSGDAAQALVEIEQVLATPFSTAEVHATASALFSRAGDASAAMRERYAAERLHPEAMREVTWIREVAR